MPKYKTVIFVHGCFWHRHKGCKFATTPSSNADYWQEKFSRNTENDKKHIKELNAQGWRVITVWECEIKKHFDETMARITKEIKAKE